MTPPSPPRDVSVEPLTPAAFAPFGQVIQAPDGGGAAANQGTARRFDDAVPLALTNQDGEPLLSLFRVQPVTLPVTCTLLERHPLSTQAFVPLGVTVRRPFQLPTSLICRVAPSAMSYNRERPRHMTILPGGGSLVRAR